MLRDLPTPNGLRAGEQVRSPQPKQPLRAMQQAPYALVHKLWCQTLHPSTQACCCSDWSQSLLLHTWVALAA